MEGKFFLAKIGVPVNIENVSEKPKKGSK